MSANDVSNLRLWVICNMPCCAYHESKSRWNYGRPQTPYNLINRFGLWSKLTCLVWFDIVYRITRAKLLNVSTLTHVIGSTKQTFCFRRQSQKNYKWVILKFIFPLHGARLSRLSELSWIWPRLHSKKNAACGNCSKNTMIVCNFFFGIPRLGCQILVNGRESKALLNKNKQPSRTSQKKNV